VRFRAVAVSLLNKLLEVVRSYYEQVKPIEDRFKRMSTFELLVGTIISQNTNWRNVERAMANLRDRGLLSPEGVLRANPPELEKALRVAGLYRVKAARIREIAERIVSSGLSLDDVLRLRWSEARAKLMELPAVGYKTADILLAFKAGAPVIPVDTHIARVSKRLGLVERGAGYEEVRAVLESAVPPNERNLFHLALIRFGREVCKAKNPSCDVCPLRDLCPSSTSKP